MKATGKGKPWQDFLANPEDFHATPATRALWRRQVRLLRSELSNRRRRVREDASDA